MLISEEIDRAADASALEALAVWMQRVSPSVALDGRDGLALDIAGCAHLWGGEAALMADLSARLDRAGIGHRLGLAPTLGAAWALAHAAPGEITRIEGGTEALKAGLAPLSVAGLRLGTEALTLLRRFGLTRIGQLEGIHRVSLARRFRSGPGASQSAAMLADEVLLRLDQAMGRLAEPLVPLSEPPEHAVRLPCAEPLMDLAGVEAGLAALLPRLAEALAATGKGARHIRLVAYRADGGSDVAQVRMARPARDPAHIIRLFAEKLSAIDAGFGIDLLVLEAEVLEPMEVCTPALGRGLTTATTDPERLSELADRLTARLGAGAVSVMAAGASHLPERAERREAYAGALADWGGGPHQFGDACASLGPRPLRVLAPPEPIEVIAELPDAPPARFVWRGVARRVARAEGPERIGPEWWRAGIGGKAAAQARVRDYYQVEDGDGRRYWLCREGLYGEARDGGGANTPSWRICGLFA